MEQNKTSKFMSLLRKYGYWVLLGVSLAVLITVITLVATRNAPLQDDDPFEPVDNAVIGLLK